jgi:hypothetical protein
MTGCVQYLTLRNQTSAATAAKTAAAISSTRARGLSGISGPLYSFVLVGGGSGARQKNIEAARAQASAARAAGGAGQPFSAIT